MAASFTMPTAFTQITVNVTIVGANIGKRPLACAVMGSSLTKAGSQWSNKAFAFARQTLVQDPSLPYVCQPDASVYNASELWDGKQQMSVIFYDPNDPVFVVHGWSGQAQDIMTVDSTGNAVLTIAAIGATPLPGMCPHPTPQSIVVDIDPAYNQFTFKPAAIPEWWQNVTVGLVLATLPTNSTESSKIVGFGWNNICSTATNPPVLSAFTTTDFPTSGTIVATIIHQNYSTVTGFSIPIELDGTNSASSPLILSSIQSYRMCPSVPACNPDAAPSLWTIVVIVLLAWGFMLLIQTLWSGGKPLKLAPRTNNDADIIAKGYAPQQLFA